MVNIKALLVKRVMILSHRRGREMTIDNVLQRAYHLSDFLADQGAKSDIISTLELMIELLDNGTDERTKRKIF